MAAAEMPDRGWSGCDMEGVTLAAFDRGRHLPVVTAWLHRPHVARWWGDPAAALAEIRQHAPTAEALIERDARPVGFLCWQVPTRRELAAAGLDDLPSDLVDIDVFIGEPDALGQGIGPAALMLLSDRLRANGVRLAGIAAALANRRALRAYDKAGFRPFRDFREAGEDWRYLVRSLALDT